MNADCPIEIPENERNQRIIVNAFTAGLLERSTLGGMLIAGSPVRWLMPEDLTVPAHQTIFRAILNLHQRNVTVDPVTVAAELDCRGELAAVGGVDYLMELTAHGMGGAK